MSSAGQQERENGQGREVYTRLTAQSLGAIIPLCGVPLIVVLVLNLSAPMPLSMVRSRIAAGQLATNTLPHSSVKAPLTVDQVLTHAADLVQLWNRSDGSYLQLISRLPQNSSSQSRAGEPAR